MFFFEILAKANGTTNFIILFYVETKTIIDVNYYGKLPKTVDGSDVRQ